MPLNKVHFKIERMRLGQRMGTLKIIERIVAREPYTSIVEPTRYGKSDIMRMSACECIYTKQASAALILSPGLQLVKQMVDKDKVAAMEERYSPEYAGLLRRVTRVTSMVNPNANGEWILSATIQYVQRNVDIFAAWVRSEIRRTGLPPIVYIDEAHTGSTTNRWGNVAKKLREAGALVVLLTATPFRENGERIVGFQFETLSEEQYKKYVTRDGARPEMITVEVYEGTRRLIRLIPDYEYGLSSDGGAWGEDPLPIAKLDFIPFEVQLRKFLEGEVKSGETLGSLPEAIVRRILGKIVRDPFVIRAGIEQFVSKLDGLRNIDSKIQGIIFCGNDRVDDMEFDKHAKEIRQELKRQAPHLRCGVSTTCSDEEEEDDQLELLIAGKLDALIVKQRGGVGLDLETLKVLLDLSPVRAAASYLQRLMRVATVYKSFVGFVIGPNEPVGVGLFNRFIIDEGGQATSAELELIEKYDVLRKEKETLPYYSVDGITDANFGDSDGRWADADLRSQVDAFFSHFTGALGHVTHATVAEHIKQGVISINMEALPRSQMSSDDEKNLLKDSIRQKHKEAVICYLMLHGLDFKTSYGTVAPMMWNTAYNVACIGTFIELGKQNDLKKLAALKQAFEKMLSKENLLKDSIRQKHKEAVSRYLMLHGLDFKTSYGTVAPMMWNTAYNVACIGTFIELDKQNDLKKLAALKQAFEKMLSKVNPAEFEEIVEESNMERAF